ncbi:hypothetical protein [Lacinutrix jangbogonensis]|uniref:hypothetical protein n=1 Tax=Lacinutrix jangbogonensis TaxID=1469557 RepID=UPI00053F2A3A|nr:hypothetical protein [Lacinutrix jangbogonensis]
MRFITTILLLFLFSSCQDIERNCTDYKTGYFEFTFKDNGIEKTAQFARTKNLNIDLFEGKIDSASIRWINDCEFIQKKINPKNMAEQRAVHFKIIATTKDSYTFQYQDASPDKNKEKRVEKGIAYRVPEFKITQ